MAWTIRTALVEMAEAARIDPNDTVKVLRGKLKGEKFDIEDPNDLHDSDIPKGFNERKHLIGVNHNTAGGKYELLNLKDVRKEDFAMAEARIGQPDAFGAATLTTGDRGVGVRVEIHATGSAFIYATQGNKKILMSEISAKTDSGTAARLADKVAKFLKGLK